MIQGKPRRYVLALLVAVVVAMFARAAFAQAIPTPEACKRSTPSDWEWWEHMCWNYPSESAKSMRGLVKHPGFLIR